MASLKILVTEEDQVEISHIVETPEDKTKFLDYRVRYYNIMKYYYGAYALIDLGFDALNEGRKPLAKSIYGFFGKLSDEQIGEIEGAMPNNHRIVDFLYLMDILTGPIAPVVYNSHLNGDFWAISGKLESNFIRPEICDNIFDDHIIAPVIVEGIPVRLEAMVNGEPVDRLHFLFNYRRQDSEFTIRVPITTKELILSVYTPERQSHYRIPNHHKQAA